METTEYKPTYEQLEKALNLATVIIRDNSPIATRHEQAINSLLAPPPPTYEEVTVERWYCPICKDTYGDFGTNRCCDPDAELVKLTGTRRVPVKQPVSYTLELTQDEAETLLRVTMRISGSAEKSRRKHTERIQQSLRTMGVKDPGEDVCHPTSSIHFEEE